MRSLLFVVSTLLSVAIAQQVNVAMFFCANGSQTAVPTTSVTVFFPAPADLTLPKPWPYTGAMQVNTGEAFTLSQSYFIEWDLSSTPTYHIDPQQSNLVAAAGQTINVVLVQDAEVRGIVWVDSNGDGVRNDGESGIEGIKVTLVDGAVGSVPQSRITDVGGNYNFESSVAACVDSSHAYTVVFDRPSGWNFTRPLAGSDRSRDSDVINQQGQSITVTNWGSISRYVRVDAGLLPAAQPKPACSCAGK
jgi:hypothetical protein